MASTYTVGDGKTYSTIQAAVDAIPGNLTGQGIQTVEVYAKAPSNTYAEAVDAYTGFTNGTAANYIDITAMVRHKGVPGDGITVTGVVGVGYVFKYYKYGRIDGFEITGLANNVTTNVVVYGSSAGSVNGIIKNNLIHDISTTGSHLAGIILAVSATAWNNIIYNLENTSNNATHRSRGVSARWAGATTYNNTVFNITAPNAAVAHGIELWNFIGNSINNYAGNCADGCFKWLAGAIAVSYCISSDDTADDKGGSGNQINKVAADQFVNTGSDFHLKAGADCIGAGQDLSGTFPDDIDGETRIAPWDVGADEYSAPGGVDRCIALDGYFIDGGNVTACTGGLLEV